MATQILHFPDSLAAGSDHVTKFWPVGYKQKKSNQCNYGITSLKGIFLPFSSTFSLPGWETTTME